MGAGYVTCLRNANGRTNNTISDVVLRQLLHNSHLTPHPNPHILANEVT